MSIIYHITAFWIPLIAMVIGGFWLVSKIIVFFNSRLSKPKNKI